MNSADDDTPMADSGAQDMSEDKFMSGVKGAPERDGVDPLSGLQIEDLTPGDAPSPDPDDGGDDAGADDEPPPVAASDDDKGDDEESEADPEKQAQIEKIIGKRLARQYETVQNLKQQNAKMEAKLKELAPNGGQPAQNTRPMVPEKPDPFSDNYEQRLDDYVKANQAAALWDREQAAAQEQAKKAANELKQKSQEQAAAFVKAGIDDGIPQEQTIAAVGMLQETNLQREVVLDLVNDPKGPRIARYLSTHPEVAEKVAAMPITQAAVHMANVVKPAAIGKPVADVPAPRRRLKGGGSKADDLPQKVTYF
jgi:hypothetical protein